MLDAQPLNLNAAFDEESPPQTQPGELLLLRAPDFCCTVNGLFSHRGPDFSSKPTTFKLQSDSLVIIRDHKVTVLISTFSEFENVPSTVAKTEELLPEAETQPEAAAEAPVPRRNKMIKVGGAGGNMFSFTSAVCKPAHTGTCLCPH